MNDRELRVIKRLIPHAIKNPTKNAFFAIVNALGYGAMMQETMRNLSGGQVKPAEARFLMELVASLDVEGPIVEIGTLFGRSTEVLAMAKQPGRRLITVDSYEWNPLCVRPDRHAKITHQLLQPLIDQDSLEIVRSSKTDFYASYDGPAPAMVFLDADHGYEGTMEDLQWALSVGTRVITGHDHQPSWPGVIRAVEECGGAGKGVGTVFLLNRPSP